jgi:hypothetical protein
VAGSDGACRIFTAALLPHLLRSVDLGFKFFL